MEDDDDLRALLSDESVALPPPTLAPIPVPVPVPPPSLVAPPMAPIPAPPSSAAAALLHRARAASAGLGGSDSDREGSVPRPSAADEYEVSEEARLARERQEKAVQELLMKRRAYAMAVPTNDSAVRARLRRLGEPITFFGEREMERRDRLRTIMVHLDAEGQLERLLKAHEDEQSATAAAGAEEGEEEPHHYPFYTEGSKELLEARIDIAKFSIARAKGRIERARRRREDPDEDEEAEAKLVVEQAGEFVLECSEIGDDRPLSGCSFSRDGTMLATWY